jgi:predicted transcriptional regulator of viral defense system
LQFILPVVLNCKFKLMNTTPLKRNYLNKYLTSVRSQGRYTFTLDELREQFDLSDTAINQSLGRLKAKKEVAQIRKGFYAIIPPEYSNQGMIPPYLFLNDLMKSLNKRYYLALLSAAALYGVSHQQPMEYFVMADSPAPRDVRNQKLKIFFLNKSDWPKDGIVPQKTDSGYINLSSPELTALDLFSFTDKFGVNRVVSVLQELTESIKPVALAKVAKRFTPTASIQRLGYVLERVLQEEKLSDAMWKVVKERNLFPIPLSPGKPQKGETDSKWKVIINIDIESDL